MTYYSANCAGAADVTMRHTQFVPIVPPVPYKDKRDSGTKREEPHFTVKLQRFRNLHLPEKTLGIKASNANVAVKNEAVKYSINFLDPFDVSWTLYLYAAVQKRLGKALGKDAVECGWGNGGIVGLLVYL